MLSTLRFASRQAAQRSAVTVVAGRAASTWANVPQGPPVSEFAKIYLWIPMRI